MRNRYELVDDGSTCYDESTALKIAFQNVTEHMTDKDAIELWYETYEDLETDLQERIKELIPLLSNITRISKDTFKFLCGLFLDYNEYYRHIDTLAYIAYSIHVFYNETDVYADFEECL